MSKRLIVTPKENGWYYILDTEHNQRVGVQKNGILKGKRFKSIAGAQTFIEKMEYVMLMQNIEERKGEL
ncbi:hypothetical protein VPH5P1C_0212 [Vibrio phage 5P1c]|nr:hypothetical protein VP193E371_P0213 [Vibrio phage 193E37-1]